MKNCEKNGKIFDHEPHHCEHNVESLKNILDHKEVPPPDDLELIWQNRQNQYHDIVQGDFEKSLLEEHKQAVEDGRLSRADLRALLRDMDERYTCLIFKPLQNFFKLTTFQEP